jgi:hypothetical protein
MIKSGDQSDADSEAGERSAGGRGVLAGALGAGANTLL